MLEHGANRDLCACGSPGPSRRDSVRRRVGAGLPRGRSRRRREPLVERVPGSRERLPVGIRRGCVACRADPSDGLHAELGARPGSARAARPAPGVATGSCDEGGACRLLWPVLAHAVRVGRHRRSAGVRLPVRELRREPLRRNMGTGLRAATSWRRGSSPRRTARTCSARAFATSVPRRCWRTGSSTPGMPSCGQPRSALAANGQDSSRQPGKSGRARGESTRRDAKRHSRRLRATRGAPG